jgi:hypothetical protein
LARSWGCAESAGLSGSSSVGVSGRARGAVVGGQARAGWPGRRDGGAAGPRRPARASAGVGAAPAGRRGQPARHVDQLGADGGGGLAWGLEPAAGRKAGPGPPRSRLASAPPASPAPPPGRGTSGRASARKTRAGRHRLDPGSLQISGTSTAASASGLVTRARRTRSSQSWIREVGTSFHAADPDSLAVVSDPADAYGRVVPGQVRAERSPTSSQRSVTLRSRRAGPRRSARCALGIRPWAREYVADRHAEQVEATVACAPRRRVWMDLTVSQTAPPGSR